jgi:replicative DNA helicase
LDDVDLPANVSAEKTILGAILLDNGEYFDVAVKIEAGDFFLDSHRRIFARMGELVAEHHAIDIITLSERLAMHHEVGSVGGVAYVAELTEGLPRRPVIDEYVQIVKDKAISRRLITVAATAISRAADQSEPSTEIINSVIEDLENSRARDWKTHVRSVGEVLVEDWPRFEAECNAPATGVFGASLFTPEINNVTCGIHQGELCLLAARPGQGKTEVAIQVAVENARRKLRVHLQSMEMKNYQIMRRMTRYIARVPISSMRDPRCLTFEQKRRIVQAREELADLTDYINIDDTHELTIAEYRSRCASAAKRWKADLIITDYAQLLIVPKARNLIEAAPKQAETLRHVARDYCRTLALAQLRRAPPTDLNRYPDIEDILGSSAFEQAAQIVLLLHRAREKKKYTGEDICFLGKMRELPNITSFKIKAEDSGAFRDRDR